MTPELILHHPRLAYPCPNHYKQAPHPNCECPHQKREGMSNLTPMLSSAWIQDGPNNDENGHDDGGGGGGDDNDAGDDDDGGPGADDNNGGDGGNSDDDGNSDRVMRSSGAKSNRIHFHPLTNVGPSTSRAKSGQVVPKMHSADTGPPRTLTLTNPFAKPVDLEILKHSFCEQPNFEPAAGSWGGYCRGEHQEVAKLCEEQCQVKVALHDLFRE
ncbi:hypothetical protein BS47DRAFT_1385269 [Hydnum rufescens UP504]|uniref:Uncharacterized protein n=1 Tax=Hydnum rufescens UP504 TaxID=1448309 RepID=A0A9P6AKT1_9AGAM|nr:hypothetical protein BS47DRAFT_1385269 [Hydnum rufescens UP504]